MKKGIFITFEGPEGSGKSTQIRLLAKHLQQRGYRVTMTREPGGTPLAGAFRKILLQTGEDLTPLAELFLYEADRAQHVDTIVRPALNKGNVVLCDRHTDSTLAYQGDGRRLNKRSIISLNTVATGGLKPALTFLLDVPAEKGLARAKKAKQGHDRLERAGLAFHKRVRKGFLRLAKAEPKRFRVIPTNQTIEEIQQAIQKYLEKVLS